jgi:hypothetical protein
MSEEKIVPAGRKEQDGDAVRERAPRPEPLPTTMEHDPRRDGAPADDEALVMDDAEEQAESAPPTVASHVVAAPEPVVPKSKQFAAIERVLEEDLSEVFWEMPPEAQTAFKKKGEETARAIEHLLREVRVQVVKILKLIKQWLALIPHVNRFFLEQEAKIKTDKIIALKDGGLGSV